MGSILVVGILKSVTIYGLFGLRERERESRVE